MIHSRKRTSPFITNSSWGSSPTLVHLVQFDSRIKSWLENHRIASYWHRPKCSSLTSQTAQHHQRDFQHSHPPRSQSKHLQQCPKHGCRTGSKDQIVPKQPWLNSRQQSQDSESTIKKTAMHKDEQSDQDMIHFSLSLSPLPSFSLPLSPLPSLSLSLPCPLFLCHTNTVILENKT